MAKASAIGRSRKLDPTALMIATALFAAGKSEEHVEEFVEFLFKVNEKLRVLRPAPKPKKRIKASTIEGKSGR